MLQDSRGNGFQWEESRPITAMQRRQLLQQQVGTGFKWDAWYLDCLYWMVIGEDHWKCHDCTFNPSSQTLLSTHFIAYLYWCFVERKGDVDDVNKNSFLEITGLLMQNPSINKKYIRLLDTMEVCVPKSPIDVCSKQKSSTSGRSAYRFRWYVNFKETGLPRHPKSTPPKINMEPGNDGFQ